MSGENVAQKSREITWGEARKKPVIVRYREPIVNGVTNINFNTVPCEVIETLEGTLIALPNMDFVIKGVDEEIYPIKKTIFEKTYDVVNSPADTEFLMYKHCDESCEYTNPETLRCEKKKPYRSIEPYQKCLDNDLRPEPLVKPDE